MATEHKTIVSDKIHASFPHGNIADRPASPTNDYNNFYYADDENKLYFHNGSSWKEFAMDIDMSNASDAAFHTIISRIIPRATSSTASGTADKVVSLVGFTLFTGSRIMVKFDNENTVEGALTLNVNSTGAFAIYNEAGVAVSATSPAYFPAGATVEFCFDGKKWRYVNRVVDSYVNGATFYNQYANGWLEQGGTYYGGNDGIFIPTITFPKRFKNALYNRHVTGGFSYSSDKGYNYIHQRDAEWMKIIVPGGIASWSAKGY